MNILRNLEFNVKKMNDIDSDGFMTIEGVAAIAAIPSIVMKPSESISFIFLTLNSKFLKVFINHLLFIKISHFR